MGAVSENILVSKKTKQFRKKTSTCEIVIKNKDFSTQRNLDVHKYSVHRKEKNQM